ncbi:MAG TPA: ferredoxin [Solirubrobacterales bacterium]|nr:ferredoxin [Solirubrobacterales bacterium]
MRLIPVVDQDHCLGYGDCAGLAPGVFAVDEVASVIGEAPPELVLRAAQACPAGAIRVLDAGAGEEVEP